MGLDRSFWAGRRVLITGNSGFKGSWLTLWLEQLGARVAGYSIDVPTHPSLYRLTGLEDRVEQQWGDIGDLKQLEGAIAAFQPEVLFHLAAQPLVLDSYNDPVGTYATNVMGTVNLLEAVRRVGGINALINVTSDKCYENREWCWGYRENEPLGGHDPYSSSKACSELVTAAYRRSFFAGGEGGGECAIATVRAGNVIGGGDWAADRLIPDFYRAMQKGEQLTIRNPEAVRPWQHVLEPLAGYLLLAQRLCEKGALFDGAWNFGPTEDDSRTVGALISCLAKRSGQPTKIDPGSARQHEAGWLKLDSSKARQQLGWKPVWSLQECLERVAEWYEAWLQGADMHSLTFDQIKSYQVQLERNVVG